MTRSQEAPKQTPTSTETNSSSQQETPLFDTLHFEYLQGGNGQDFEVIGSDSVPVFAVLSEGNGSDEARKEYKDLLMAVPADAPESDIPVYLEMGQHQARQLDPSFGRPAAIVQLEDKIFWNASAGAGTTGLAVVSDARGERLGMTVNAGVITELPAGHKLVIADNDLLERLDMNGVLNLSSIVNDKGSRELYPLYSAVLIDGSSLASTPNEQPVAAESLTQEAATKEAVHAKRKKEKLDKLGLPYDATNEQIKDAQEKRREVRNAANTATRAAKHRAAGSPAPLDGATTNPEPDTAPGLGISETLRREMLRIEKERLDDLRKDMAGVAAKRQGRLFSMKNNKHAELEAQYDQQLAVLGKLECAALLNDETKTDSEKNVGVIGFIFDEQQRLREATAEQLKNTHVSKMIKWVNSGTKTQRLLKGAAVGAGGVLLGAGAGAIIGAAAGIGLAAAATVTATSVTRFGRYYAKEDNKQGRGMSILDEAQSQKAKLDAIHHLEQNSNGDKFVTASKQFKELFDADTKKEQEKRRKSARHAIGGVALGMVVGGTAAYAIGELADGAVGSWANRIIDTPEAAAQPVDAAPEGGAPANVDGGPETKQPDIAPEPTPAPVYEFSLPAKTIEVGEGWLQTFNDMGITSPTEQYALLNNHALMQELANQGLAYPDVTLGGWGISMTADGKMPVESLKLIEDYAKRSGYDLAS